ncbi:MAG TPA: glycosyltransferase, partial [Flavisolibacter sp.]|nr:glycosyltransferase [Flavisolibacter sp.]
MSEKNILIITYYWPPSGGAAVQRWLSFSNKLVQQGISVHLLTVDPKYATYQLYDESLLNQIDHRIQIHTTKTFEPFGLYKVLFGKNSIPKPAFSDEVKPSLLKKASRFVRGNFFIPDPRKGWKPYAVKKAFELIEKHGIKTVITAGPPHSTHFIGNALKEKIAIKWIADFHDLWTDVIYYNLLYHLPIVKRKDRQLERLILESADIIITVGEKYKEKLLQKSDRIEPNKIHVLRIGYDETIFNSISKPTTPSTQFTITYTGSIADFYEPEVFFRALKQIKQNYPQVQFCLRFVGVLSAGIRENIKKLQLDTILDEVGYVSHKRSIQYLLESTLLLLVNPITKDEEMVIPGKVYEYLAAQKPIVNITKTSAETAQLIEQCAAGKTFDRNMQGEIEYHLEQLVLNWQKKQTLDIN